jgi:threonine dehydrogenase-like Zn-dependent dehydrogenase
VRRFLAPARNASSGGAGGDRDERRLYERDFVLPQRELYFKGITYRTGRPNVRPAMEPVLALCHSGAVKPRDVPQSVFPFDDAIEAWLSHVAGS